MITSYAVAEAITVPLTGWLAGRFGAVRVFCHCGRGAFGALLAALRLLAIARYAGRHARAAGPVRRSADADVADPAAAHLPDRAVQLGLGLRAMTTLIAPVAGPVLGGALDRLRRLAVGFLHQRSDFRLCSFMVWRLLKSRQTDDRPGNPVD